MKRRYIRYIVTAVFVLMIVLLLWGGYRIVAVAEEEIFVSPEGTNTIIVRYDLVCRPTIYKKGLLLRKKIFDYPGNGFTETVHFGVEWLAEDRIRFTYDDTDDEYDEEYVITIP